MTYEQIEAVSSLLAFGIVFLPLAIIVALIIGILWRIFRRLR